MKVSITPTTEEGRDAGQHAASAERPTDDLDVIEVVRLFAAALRGYGCTDEMIAAGCSAFISDQFIRQTDSNAANC